jgi:hypothetical protein
MEKETPGKRRAFFYAFPLAGEYSAGRKAMNTSVSITKDFHPFKAAP